MAALAVGSGLGAHYAQEYAAWVASAGVLSMAYLGKLSHGQEMSRVMSEVSQLQAEMLMLRQQMEEHRRQTQSGLATMATISHEIRSPLSAVIALGDLLQKAPLGPEQQRMVRDLVEAGHMVMNVVNDSLDYAKAEVSTLDGSQEVFSLKDLMERVTRQTRVLATKKPGLRVEVIHGPLDWIRGDEGHLQQILLNLCANAVKFSESGVIRLSAEAAAYADQAERQMLVVKVRDSGPGISAERQAQLFKPYARADGNRSNAVPGTGLGLFLSRKLAKNMGGTIGVNSQPGQGSEFWVSIPVLPAQELVAPHAGPLGSNRHTDHDAAQPTLSGLVVGIVDDARINREVTRRIVEAHGGGCVLMESGDELIEAALQGRLKVDILLLDIEMPGLGGLDAAAQLRRLQSYESMTILAVSALATDDIRGAIQNGDLNGFLPKPFHAHALIQKISAYAGIGGAANPT